MKCYQVLNNCGNPAGNDLHEHAIFDTKEKAQAWIDYLIEDIKTGGTYTVREMLLIEMPTEDQIKSFCEDHYYCDCEDDDGNSVREKWEPFEYDEDETIAGHVDNDVYALKRFLEIKD